MLRANNSLPNLRITGCLFTLLWCLVASNIVGQVKTYKAIAYQEESGLSSLQVSGIASTNNGLLYFNTNQGLTSFNGFRWNQIASVDTTGIPCLATTLSLPNNAIGWLSVLRDTVRYNLLNSTGYSYYALPFRKISNNDIQPLLAANPTEDNLGVVAAIGNELYFLLDGRLEHTTKLKFPKSGTSTNQIIYYNNQLLLCTTDGLFVYNAYTQKIRRYWPDQFSGKNILRAVVSRYSNKLYLLGSDWLAEWSSKRVRFLKESIYRASSNPYINASYCGIYELGKNNIIFYHNQSLSLYNTKTNQREPFRLSSPFSGAIPTQILKDIEGNIWVTTLRGVAQLNSFAFSSLDKVAGLPDSEVSAIAEREDGTMVIGGNLGINLLKNDQWIGLSNTIENNKSANTRILDMSISGSKVYIAGNETGLGILDENNRISWIYTPDVAMVTAVTSFKGDILVGSNVGTIYRLVSGKLEKFYEMANGTYCRKLITTKNSVLIITTNGLFEYKNNKIKQVATASTSSLKQLYGLAFYNNDTLLATRAGLAVCRSGVIEKVSYPGFKNDNPAYAILTENDSSFWLGTDKGVNNFRKGKSHYYSGFSGLVGHEINRGALIKNKQGKIWIGTDEGLNIFDPLLFASTSVIPNLTITSIRASEKQLPTIGPESQKIKLAHDDNTLEFGFSATTYTNPKAIEYRYRLEGLEDDWNYSRNYLQNHVRYPFVAPGNYRFIAQARYEANQWGSPATSYQITIVTAWYKSVWAILAYLTLGALAVYVAYYIIIQNRVKIRLRDAVEKTKADALLSETKFKAIWEAMDTGLLVVSNTGKIVMSNPTACTLFAHVDNNLVGSFTDKLVNHSKFTKSYIKSYYNNPYAHQFELEEKLEGGNRYLLITFSAVEIIAGVKPLVIISCKNITDFKQVELKNKRLNNLLRQQNSDLRQQEGELATTNKKLIEQKEDLKDALKILEERNFELDQFVYKTSHDLRAPIASSLGLINLMRLDNKECAWRNYADLIEKSLKKQDSFISAMLSFSKSARAQEIIERINLSELVGQCLEDLQYLPKYNTITIEVAEIEREVKFYSEKMKLNIVLTNILANCIKYQDPKAESYLKVNFVINNDSAVITITDNGIGIDSLYIDRIFDMFYRATELSDGSGLGLYIVKQTLTRLGGEIAVKSKIGKGSEFSIALPNRIHAVPEISITSNSAPASKQGN